MADTECGFNDVAGGASGADLLVSRGPTLLVNIGFDPSFSAITGVKPQPGLQGVEALVDTGASTSCIDNLLGSQLNLPIIDRIQISGAGGHHMANMYLAQIYIPSLSSTIIGSFAGVDLLAGGQRHSALIGRSFLRNCRMEYDGTTGSVKLIK